MQAKKTFFFVNVKIIEIKLFCFQIILFFTTKTLNNVSVSTETVVWNFGIVELWNFTSFFSFFFLVSLFVFCRRIGKLWSVSNKLKIVHSRRLLLFFPHSKDKRIRVHTCNIHRWLRSFGVRIFSESESNDCTF